LASPSEHHLIHKTGNYEINNTERQNIELAMDCFDQRILEPVKPVPISVDNIYFKTRYDVIQYPRFD